MSVVTLSETQSDGLGEASQSSRGLFNYLVSLWQRVSEERRQLWRAYDDFPDAHRIPRSVWRRHAALLLNARRFG